MKLFYFKIYTVIHYTILITSLEILNKDETNELLMVVYQSFLAMYPPSLKLLLFIVIKRETNYINLFFSAAFHE